MIFVANLDAKSAGFFTMMFLSVYSLGSVCFVLLGRVLFAALYN
jgi:hypothetical protein